MLRNVSRELGRVWRASQHVVSRPMRTTRSLSYSLHLHAPNPQTHTTRGYRKEDVLARTPSSFAQRRHIAGKQRKSCKARGRLTRTIAKPPQRQGTLKRHRHTETLDPKNVFWLGSLDAVERIRRDWNIDGVARRHRGRLVPFAKSWSHKSPNLLLKSLLVTRMDDQELRRNTAMARTTRLPVVLMQMMIRNQELAKPDGSELLALLPDKHTWQQIMDFTKSNGHSQKELDHYLEILTCGNDVQRIAAFLKYGAFKPLWMLHYILRRHSDITTGKTLYKLINYFERQLSDVEKDTHNNKSRSSTTQGLPSATPTMTLQDFSLTIALFVHHCMRLQPRLLVRVAKLIAYYIRSFERMDRPRQSFHVRCLIFNHGLKLFQPKAKMIGNRAAIPNAYFWEAQRILLDTSSSLKKPLLLQKVGFQAIRIVLAGLRKDQADVHSASLHSQTWPPYRRPGHGMDERMDPEEGWSRTVRAGMMMQEAGYPKEEVDEVLDILQGLAPDGTPTIQQRVAGVLDHRNLSVWAASIRATRNAQEAWLKFQQPVKLGQKPGIDEYTAMFEKLSVREADPKFENMPGDNSLNYPIHDEPNLTDFEKSRLKPPSVEELYQQMKVAGIKPSGPCLGVLVRNAESLDTAHRYLLESNLTWDQCSCLLFEHPNLEVLRTIPDYLFSAYINVCARETNGPRGQFIRAIKLTALRLEGIPSAAYNSLWLPILKNLGQYRLALGMSLKEQLGLLLKFLQQCQASEHETPLSTFNYFTRCLQKILRYDTRRLPEDLERSTSLPAELSLLELPLLYDGKSEYSVRVRKQAETAGFLESIVGSDSASSEIYEQSPLFSVHLAMFYIKGFFNAMVAAELETCAYVTDSEVSPLDRMLSRRDPVQARYVYDYVMLLAYSGEFQELARVVKWAMQEWGQPDVVEELQDMDQLPHQANLFETLCAFRAFAEPMLPRQELISVREVLNSSEMGWAWPDDEMVEAYVQGDEASPSHDGLRRLLLWTRNRQLQRQ